ncbi:MAG: hypothetical protein IPM30_07040 [Burkholderiales bacterium]|nr:hypothetical protein [Burkholderiales bacterium]
MKRRRTTNQASIPEAARARRSMRCRDNARLRLGSVVVALRNQQQGFNAVSGKFVRRKRTKSFLRVSKQLVYVVR